eukprot:COSAG06_NODE_4972_length_3817_cov_9.879236_2_plen_57_part_00
MIQGGAQGTMRLDDFARTFAWADDKYPTQTPLRDMVDEIVTVRSACALSHPLQPWR